MTANAVEKFLYEFHEKLKIYDIRFDDFRAKNFQALLNLEISSDYRIRVIKALKVNDYVKGPIKNTLKPDIGDMWVFGKILKGTEIYIKIAYGPKNSPVVCISFHDAERPLVYPLKNKRP